MFYTVLTKPDYS